MLLWYALLIHTDVIQTLLGQIEVSPTKPAPSATALLRLLVNTAFHPVIRRTALQADGAGGGNGDKSLAQALITMYWLFLFSLRHKLLCIGCFCLFYHFYEICSFLKLFKLKCCKFVYYLKLYVFAAFLSPLTCQVLVLWPEPRRASSMPRLSNGRQRWAAESFRTNMLWEFSLVLTF